MANSNAVKDAANAMLLATRQFIEAIEIEESASTAAVPAHMVNMPPETRAARGDPLTAPADDADDAKLADDADKTPKPPADQGNTPSARRSATS